MDDAEGDLEVVTSRLAGWLGVGLDDLDEFGDVGVLGVARTNGEGNPPVVQRVGDAKCLGVGCLERGAHRKEEAGPEGEAVLGATVGLGEDRDDLRVGAGLGEDLVLG